MHTRSFWLLGGIFTLAAAAVIVGHVAQADQPIPQLDLRALTDHFVLGQEVPLEVSVPPHLIGGHAALFATINGHTDQVGAFPIEATVFVVPGPVPGDPALIGLPLDFHYEAFNPMGEPVGASKPAGSIIEPEFE